MDHPVLQESTCGFLPENIKFLQRKHSKYNNVKITDSYWPLTSVFSLPNHVYSTSILNTFLMRLTVSVVVHSTKTWVLHVGWFSQKHPMAQTNKQRNLTHFDSFRVQRDCNKSKSSVTHKCPTEMCWCFVPAGATGSILTHVDVIHQTITIQETLPCERHNHQWSAELKMSACNYRVTSAFPAITR